MLPLPHHRPAWRARRPLAGLLLAVLAALVLLPGAAAHARFERATPAPGAVLTEPPAWAWLALSQLLEPHPDTWILVNDASGQPADFRNAAIVGIDERTLGTRLLPDLPDGVYTVEWSAVANEDLHVTSGTYQFTIDRAGTPSAGDVRLLSPARAAFAVSGGALALTLGSMWWVARRRQPAPR